MKRRFLYQQVASDIMERIVSGSYRDGDVLESNEVLIERYRASSITINKALGSLVAKGVVKRIPGKGSLVSYDGHAVRDRAGTRMIGTVVFDMSQPDVWAGSIKAIEDYLYPLGYQLVVGNDSGSVERMVEYIDRFVSQGIEGFVFVPLSCATEKEFGEVNKRIASRIRQAGLSYVVMHRVLRNIDTAQVGFDNYQDSLTLTETILRSGRSRPVMLSHDYHNSVIGDRERGFLDVLRSDDESDPRSRIIRLSGTGNQSGSHPDYGAMLTHELRARGGGDALIAVDDHYLKILVNIGQSERLFMDKKVLLSGFGCFDEAVAGGVIDIYQRQEPSELGETAIALLMDRLRRGDTDSRHIVRIPSVLTFGT